MYFATYLTGTLSKVFMVIRIDVSKPGGVPVVLTCTSWRVVTCVLVLDHVPKSNVWPPHLALGLSLGHAPVCTGHCG